MPFDRETLRARLAELAASGVSLGTSSWKYPGWCGMVYDEARYWWRGTFSRSRFDKTCLAEYAETFKTVSVDATYYAPPSAKFLEEMASLVPADFRFSFKVPEAITVKRMPNLPRHGELAGRWNPRFLDPEAFERDFLKPLESIHRSVGILMFQFSQFSADDFAHGRDFVAALETFLAAIPKTWRYGIELRNKSWLVPDYFDCLARHGIGHVFNAWTNMPTVTDQMAIVGSRPNPGLVGARFLLRPGRSYGDAITTFEPFDTLKEVNDDARGAARALVQEGLTTAGRETYIYINNRLEGCAPRTILSIVDALQLRPGSPSGVGE